MIVKRICKKCKKEFTLQVRESDYNRWLEGTLIQQAMPYLTVGERELLISGICSECYDKIFAE